ncbi:MAG: hypothetical protein E7170_01195 [Firmicutes bacterium]|nr:hypothetical protein [Bacillota bacterium]
MKRIFLGLLCAILMVSFATGCGKEETPQNEEQNNVVDNNEFSMPIEEIFTITGRGVVAKGTIQKGDIRIGDKVRIICEDEVIDTEVVGIEINRKQLDEAKAGDTAGVLLKKVTREQVEKGKTLVKINSNEEDEQGNDNSNVVVDNTNAFLMPVEDVFTITGRGTVATGRILRGNIKVGDKIQIIGMDEEIIDTEVVGIEINRKQLEEANTGDNVGIILKDVTRTQVMRGQVLAKPNSIVNSKKFDADIHVYLQDEGGRNESISSNEKLVYYLRTLDIAGELQILNDAGKLNPGEDGKITVILNSKMALEVGTEFSIRENGRIVAKGTITKVY